MKLCSCGARRIDPDPITIAALVLTATGTTTAVASFVAGRLEKWKQTKRRKKALEVGKYVRRLRGHLEKIKERADYIFAIATKQNPNAPFLLGSAPMLLTASQLQSYWGVYNEILVEMQHAGTVASMIMTLIMGEKDFSRQGTFADLANMNKRGNEVLTQHLSISEALPRIREYVSETIKRLEDLEALLKSIGA